MREKKWTEGPWKAVQTKCNGVAIRCSVRKWKAKTCTVDMSTHLNWKANAHLIAASPELLDALENATALLKTLCGNTDDIANDVIEISDKALDKVRSPMGLELNAETPAEIALSIMAEIIMLRQGGDGSVMASSV